MKFKGLRYDPLLRYREFQEETKKYQLAEVLEILELEEKKLFALEEICRQAVEELEERQQRETQPHEIFMYHSYLQQIKLEMSTQRKRVAEVMNTYDERKKAVISASQDKMVVEKVRDKEIRCQKDGVNKEEKKMMNEIGTNRFIRNS